IWVIFPTMRAPPFTSTVSANNTAGTKERTAARRAMNAEADGLVIIVRAGTVRYTVTASDSSNPDFGGLERRSFAHSAVGRDLPNATRHPQRAPLRSDFAWPVLSNASPS